MRWKSRLWPVRTATLGAGAGFDSPIGKEPSASASGLNLGRQSGWLGLLALALIAASCADPDLPDVASSSGTANDTLVVNISEQTSTSSSPSSRDLAEVGQDKRQLDRLVVTTSTSLPYDPSRYFEFGSGSGTYLCEETYRFQEYECATYFGGPAPAIGTPDLYCSGPQGTLSCAEYNPNEYFEVRFQAQTYLCQETYSFQQYECSDYFGGPAPYLGTPALYCSGSRTSAACTEYDPDKYFEISSDGRRYLCEAQFSPRQYNCTTFSGGSAPRVSGAPDLYCSGSESYPDCSSNWYPDELTRYDIYEINGSSHLCKRSIWGGFNDYDCSRYAGGDPSRVSFSWPDLKCTETLGRMQCDRDEYPSAIQEELDRWDNLSVARINGSSYICESGFQGDSCYRCWGECSPDQVGFFPDYYCNNRGCSPDSWP
ncbi:MAG: hypothetical protein ACI8Y4_005166 [Candidatus Poriferisodalaceae bacterium]|jgi:hypothetical protein